MVIKVIVVQKASSWRVAHKLDCYMIKNPPFINEKNSNPPRGKNIKTTWTLRVPIVVWVAQVMKHVRCELRAASSAGVKSGKVFSGFSMCSGFLLPLSALVPLLLLLAMANGFRWAGWRAGLASLCLGRAGRNVMGQLSKGYLRSQARAACASLSCGLVPVSIDSLSCSGLPEADVV